MLLDAQVAATDCKSEPSERPRDPSITAPRPVVEAATCPALPLLVAAARPRCRGPGSATFVREMTSSLRCGVEPTFYTP